MRTVPKFLPQSMLFQNGGVFCCYGKLVLFFTLEGATFFVTRWHYGFAEMVCFLESMNIISLEWYFHINTLDFSSNLCHSYAFISFNLWLKHKISGKCVVKFSVSKRKNICFIREINLGFKIDHLELLWTIDWYL